jgi:hypothetical protein
VQPLVGFAGWGAHFDPLGPSPGGGIHFFCFNPVTCGGKGHRDSSRVTSNRFDDPSILTHFRFLLPFFWGGGDFRSTSGEKSLGTFQIPYDVLIFEDEGHGISKPANEVVLY